MGQQLMGQAAPHALPPGASTMTMGGFGGMGGGMRNPTPATSLLPNTPGLAASPGVQNTPFLAQLLQRLGS
jgi:hypothetical protein